jgi:wobble nucleotide-excising tRNase
MCGCVMDYGYRRNEQTVRDVIPQSLPMGKRICGTRPISVPTRDIAVRKEIANEGPYADQNVLFAHSSSSIGGHVIRVNARRHMQPRDYGASTISIKMIGSTNVAHAGQVPEGTPMIARFATLKGVGVFPNYTTAADVPELRKHNLIYGLNGSGKTTLSRVLASLGGGSMRPQLPSDCAFTIVLANGTVVKSTDGLQTLKGRLLVFNVDFIDDNLKWKEGTANPVFYIGKQQADLAEKLEKTEKDLAAITAGQEQCRQKLVKADKSFSDFKSAAAKAIAEQLGVRNYNAAVLASDYGTRMYGPADEIPQEDIQPLLGAIAQQAPLPKRNLVDARPLALSSLSSTTQRLLGTTLGELTVAELREHGQMVRWVKEGVEYHTAHALSSCLLCGNELTAERIEALKVALDNRLDRLNVELNQAKATAAALRDRATALATLPSTNDFSVELRTDFSAAAGPLSIKLGEAQDAAVQIIALLEAKLAAPTTRIDAATLITDDAAAVLVDAVAGLAANLNAVINRHNVGVDKFAEGKEAGRTRIKAHNLARNQASYRKLEGEARTAKAGLDDTATKQTALVKEAEALRQSVRTHGPAAGRINGLLHAYLGHKELDIATLATGYQIRRNGTPVTSSLSEGEKTAIALCYFLSTLEAEDRRRKDLIVVVDDPISSLDTRALHHAFGLIKSSLSDAGQLIIMTHNIHFMNAVKKWLMRAARPKTGPATATLLFLDASQDAQSGLRAATIQELPKLLREYESEYHYLFHLVLKLVDGQDVGHLYLMPNALRKVLDIFLGFRLPGGSGLGDKMTQITAEYKLDPTKMVALDRLVQLESHADSLDDIVTFSSMTIEETTQAAKTLVEMMKVVDPLHLDKMSGLCR